MGDLRLNDISYSGNGTGVLMLNGINYTGGGSGGGGGGLEPISLVSDSEWIATGATNRAKTPIDVNNYIEVSGNTVTLHRTNSSYGLVVRIPNLKANHVYILLYDSITNSDNNLYEGLVTSITASTMIDSRIGSYTYPMGSLWRIAPAADNDYTAMFWSNNTNDIILDNPRLLDLGELI